MAKLYLQEHPKQSRESLARKLTQRLSESGVSYHPRTIKRQLDGSVSSVPPAVEEAMRELLVRGKPNRDPADVEEDLAKAGLQVPKKARVHRHVAVQRLVAPTRLWLYLNPGHTKRFLAHQLSKSLERKDIHVSPDRLQSNLAGKGSYVRREVLAELIGLLGKHGLMSEADVIKAYEKLTLQVEQALEGRKLQEADRFKRLADTWWVLRGGDSKRALAKELQEKLASKGITLSLDHLQDLFHGRKDVVQSRVVNELEALVRSELPSGRSLEQAMAEAERSDERATDLHWVKAEPIARAAKAWLDEHPDMSRRALALKVAEVVRDMGYSTSHNTVQPVLAGTRKKTRGYIYRATMKVVTGEETPSIPDSHVLRKRVGRAERPPIELERPAAEEGEAAEGAEARSEATAGITDPELVEFLEEARRRLEESGDREEASSAAMRAERLFGIPRAEAESIIMNQ